MTILGLFVLLVVWCLVFWGARTLMGAFSVPAPVQAVVTVALVVIAVLSILSTLGLGTGPVLRLR